MASNLCLISASYLLCGATLKITDDVFDERIYPRWIGIASIAVCATFGGVLIFFDPWTRAVFSSIVVGLLAARKIDNLAFLLGMTLGVLLPLGLLALLGRWEFDGLVASVVALFTWLDEAGNDWFDRRRPASWIGFVLEFRFSLKLAVLVLCITGALPWRYLLAFLLFDVGYGLLAVFGKKRKATFLTTSW